MEWPWWECDLQNCRSSTRTRSSLTRAQGTSWRRATPATTWASPRRKTRRSAWPTSSPGTAPPPNRWSSPTAAKRKRRSRRSRRTKNTKTVPAPLSLFCKFPPVSVSVVAHDYYFISFVFSVGSFVFVMAPQFFRFGYHCSGLFSVSGRAAVGWGEGFQYWR